MRKRFQEYSKALEFLYAQLPMYQRVGKAAFKPGLANIIRLLEAMGNPQQQFQSIHIAGTNGKGSTTHMLGAVLQASSKKVGLYTSPHYADFRERVKIDGALISEASVLEFLNQYWSQIEIIKPSYFELTVAMAFDYFAQEQVDYAVIETGLGGRLDSTNVITPILSVITNISYDHMDVLGDTLAKIAFEKAGIIKESIPVVIGEKHPETQPVFQDRANACNAPISFAEDFWKVEIQKFNKGQMLIDIFKENTLWQKDLNVDISGVFQAKNLQTVLQVFSVLKNQIGWTEENLFTGLANVRSLSYFIGRWQILKNQPLTIADSAHNKAALELVMNQLKSFDYQDLHLVIGFSKDKDHKQMLALMPKQAKFYFAKPKVLRGLPAEELYTKATAMGLKGDIYPSVAAALAAANSAAQPEDLIYVGGSSFTVAEVV